jgi:hypothetical protein
VDDGVKFTVSAISPIRADDIYGGYRVALTSGFDTMKTRLSIDVSTGDVITPRAVKFSLHGILDEKKTIDLWAYNMETVMAEKVESILSRNIFNSRPWDFYDIYILATTQDFDASLFREAILATANHRGSAENIADGKGLILRISESAELRQMWAKYQRQFDYAAGISYEQIIGVLGDLLINKNS